MQPLFRIRIFVVSIWWTVCNSSACVWVNLRTDACECAYVCVGALKFSDCDYISSFKAQLLPHTHRPMQLPICLVGRGLEQQIGPVEHSHTHTCIFEMNRTVQNGAKHLYRSSINHTFDIIV